MGLVASGFHKRSIWPWLAIAFTLVAAAFQLYFQGRLWLCSCDQFLLWVGEARSSNTSQHLLDPYSFTHILHGFDLFWLLEWLAPRLSWTWRLWLAIAVEAVWEAIENSDFVIRRYREAGALGYFGDTIVNSLADLPMCGVGFVLARSSRVRTFAGVVRRGRGGAALLDQG
jgi:Protein of unknown function (DUF2585)